jgi:hypothetical protein
MGAVYNTWLSEKFAADVRYSGISLTFQIASVIGAGLSPLIAVSLLAASKGRPDGVALYFGGICFISFMAYFFGGERFNQNLLIHTAEEKVSNARI